jgi:membrane protease YdiL (CAAX protease family)
MTFKRWIAEVWDDALVYLVSIVGSITALWWASDKIGEKFVFKWGYIAVAVGLAIVIMAAIETARHSDAVKKNELAAHVLGKRRRLVSRLGLSWAVGFIGQLAFPGVVENVVNLIIGVTRFGG